MKHSLLVALAARKKKKKEKRKKNGAGSVSHGVETGSCRVFPGLSTSIADGEVRRRSHNVTLRCVERHGAAKH